MRQSSAFGGGIGAAVRAGAGGVEEGALAGTVDVGPSLAGAADGGPGVAVVGAQAQSKTSSAARPGSRLAEPKVEALATLT